MKTLRIKTNLVFGIIAVCTAVALWLIIPWQVPASLITNEKIDGRFMPPIYVSFILSSIVFGCCSLLYMKTKDFRKYLVVTVVIIAVSIAFKYGLRVRFGGIWGI